MLRAWMTACLVWNRCGLTDVDQPRDESVNLDLGRVSERFIDRILPEFARDHLVISQGLDDEGREVLVVSGRDPRVDLVVAHNVSVALGRPVITQIASAEHIAAALDELAAQRANEETPDDDTEWEAIDARDIAAAINADDHDLLSTSGRAPVVRLTNAILFEALQARASDVHVQPRVDALVVRYRVDGVLTEARSLPRKLTEPVISRVKVMAQMDIAERRLPQDGRTTVTIGEHEVDLRISSIPTAQGERVVIRLLDKGHTHAFTLAQLGMPSQMQGVFARLCERPHGMVLVTGPTGSGKSTTLYSVLRKIDAEAVNIMTLEDPIEYELPGVSQSQVNLRKGITFITGLRHILRQDPDVIMVGEIRDSETARIAIQSALTGHLVFSTLHTNDAAGAVVRLMDLGVEPYLVNASLAAVLAQRLVRTLCSECHGGETMSACTYCRGVGFRGRTGIYELLTMDEEIRELVAQGGDVATVARISQSARSRGMQTLREAGHAAVIAGITTRHEVDRVTLVEDVPLESEVREPSEEPT